MSAIPRISVVTINLNNKSGLERTITSVLGQTRPPQLIVIDGASTDGSREVILAHEQGIASWLSEPDGGIYEAMNKGIARAEGEYVLFLNSGDSLANAQVMEFAAPLLTGAQVISGDLVIHENGIRHQVKSDDEISLSSFRRISLHHQATFISRSLFSRFGLYDTGFRIAGDMEFFIRVLLREGCTYVHIPLVICDYYADGISNQPSMQVINADERRRAWERNFSAPVLRAFEEVEDFRASRFAWIIRRTKTKGFFYYFFSFWHFIFMAGRRLLDKGNKRTR